MREHLARISLVAAGVAALALLVAFIALRPQSTTATFTPSVTIRFCNGLPADFPSSLPTNDADLVGNPSCADPASIPADTALDLTTTYNVPPNDTNSAFSITIMSGTVSTDAAIPNGEKTVGVTSLTTLGLLNGPCSTTFTVDAILYDSATTGATVSPNPEGTTNRYAPLVTDADLDGLGDSTSPLVQSNVSFYPTFLDPDLDYPGGPNGPLPPILPIARYSGAARVPPGTGDWQVFSLLVVSQSSLAQFDTDPDNRTNPLARAPRGSGTQNFGLTVINDPTATQASISPITDLCTPVGITAMMKGVTPGGFTRGRTPAAGSWGYGQWSMGARDADGDGYDNIYDTCPFNANTDIDADMDGIDSACDPTVGNTGLGDHDGDLFYNRQDICPLIANGGAAQRSSESTQTYVVAAPDGGPGNDAIGDACDPNPTTANTEGSFSDSLIVIPKCIASTDADSDGYCAAQDLNDSSAGTTGFVANPGTDQECCAAKGDSFGWFTELHVGTDPLDACGFSPGGATSSNTWPADLVESNSINISDVLALKPVFNSIVPPTSRRFDLVPSKSINISDVLSLKPLFNTSCIP